MISRMISQKLFYFQKFLANDLLLEITERNPTNENFTKDKLQQYNLIRKDDFNAAVLAHKFLMQKLFAFFLERFFPDVEIKNFKLDNLNFNPTEKIDLNFLNEESANRLIEILEFLHTDFLNSEFVFQNGELEKRKSKINLKESGAVYTKKEIAENIVLQTFQNRVSQGIDAKNLQILDFGCGTGRFYVAALKILNDKFGISKSSAVKNIYALDSDKIALTILKLKLAVETGIENLETINQNILHRNMLVLNDGLNFGENIYFDFHNDFVEVFEFGGFDVVVSNPPYYLLKINKNKSDDSVFAKYYQSLVENVNRELQYFRNSGTYKHSIEGMLNYYKLSIEMMLKLAKPNGELGVICPSTLFGDASSTKLRKFILDKNKLRKLEFFSESAKLFDNVSQATAIFFVSKASETKEIKIKFDENEFEVSLDLLKTTFPENLEIPQMDEIGWGILKKLSRFKKLKDFKNLRNRRGEFDLLQFKNLTTRKDTNFHLIRGNMINCRRIDYEKNGEFVKIDEFIKAKSNEFIKNDFRKIRLVCQQISNIDVAKRLNFVFCKETDILGNSCNYISATDETDLRKLQILLNSYLLNWRFKITSTNNHVNNYELAELPLLDFTRISDLTGNDLENNIEIAKMYKLNDNEIEYVLKNHFELSEIRRRL